MFGPSDAFSLTTTCREDSLLWMSRLCVSRSLWMYWCVLFCFSCFEENGRGRWGVAHFQKLLHEISGNFRYQSLFFLTRESPQSSVYTPCAVLLQAGVQKFGKQFNLGGSLGTLGVQRNPKGMIGV